MQLRLNTVFTYTSAYYRSPSGSFVRGRTKPTTLCPKILILYNFTGLLNPSFACQPHEQNSYSQLFCIKRGSWWITIASQEPAKQPLFWVSTPATSTGHQKSYKSLSQSQKAHEAQFSHIVPNTSWGHFQTPLFSHPCNHLAPQLSSRGTCICPDGVHGFKESFKFW